MAAVSSLGALAAIQRVASDPARAGFVVVNPARAGFVVVNPAWAGFARERILLKLCVAECVVARDARGASAGAACAGMRAGPRGAGAGTARVGACAGLRGAVCRAARSSSRAASARWSRGGAPCWAPGPRPAASWLVRGASPQHTPVPPGVATSGGMYSGGMSTGQFITSERSLRKRRPWRGLVKKSPIMSSVLQWRTVSQP